MKNLTEQVKDSKELLAAVGAVIAMVIAGYWWLQDSIRDRELAVVEKYSEILNATFVETAIGRIDSITARHLAAAVDTMLFTAEVNRYADSLMHLRTLRRTDDIVLRLDRLAAEDEKMQVRLDTIEEALRRLRGFAELSHEDMKIRALTDSLQNELILIRQEQLDRARRRQMEEQHLREMKEIRDLSRDRVIDRGRTKRVRSKPKRVEGSAFPFPNP